MEKAISCTRILVTLKTNRIFSFERKTNIRIAGLNSASQQSNEREKKNF
jgi:hypothetical protein